MNAAADYAAAAAALNKPLPAYVAYTQKTHIKMDAIVRDDQSDLVVRTSDGTIVKGKAPDSSVGVNQNSGSQIIKDPPFKTSCYEPTGAKMVRFEGRDLEAIALHNKCDEHGHGTGFETLYLEPSTRDPVAATVAVNKSPVEVAVDERFARTGAYVLPTSLYVRVKGSGLMFWLDATADMHYANYRFSDKAP